MCGRWKGRGSVYGTAISIDRHGRTETRSLPPRWRFFSRLVRPTENREKEKERERRREASCTPPCARFYIYKKKGEERGDLAGAVYFRRTESLQPRVRVLVGGSRAAFCHPAVRKRRLSLRTEIKPPRLSLRPVKKRIT